MKTTKLILSILALGFFFVAYAHTSATTFMVTKQYCLCSPFAGSCSYWVCDDGNTGPIAITLVTMPNVVQAGQPVVISAEGGYENTAPANVRVQGTLGYPQSSGPAGNNNMQFNFSPTAFPISVRPIVNGIFENMGIITGTAPQTAGNYTLGFSSFFNPPPEGPINRVYTSSFSYAAMPITVQASAQCSDSLNNDNAQGADTLDPECHTDCNVNNPGSYVPNHNSETTPPNGSCPVGPTLNLNGRSAFLDIAKNIVAFLTAKAFAGE